MILLYVHLEISGLSVHLLKGPDAVLHIWQHIYAWVSVQRSHIHYIPLSQLKDRKNSERGKNIDETVRN